MSAPKWNIYLLDDDRTPFPILLSADYDHFLALPLDPFIRWLRDALRKAHSNQERVILTIDFFHLVLNLAIGLHEMAIATRDMGNIEFTWRQLRRVETQSL